MAKKSFNPFKMWGAYVGAILILPILFLLSGIRLFNDTILGFFGFNSEQLRFVFLSLFDLSIFTTNKLGLLFIGSWIIAIILGFLIGWGIHSIVRAVRN